MRQFKIQRTPNQIQGCSVSVVLTFVVRKVAARMLDIEFGLRMRVESFHEFLKSGSARNDDDLLEHGYFLTGAATAVAGRAGLVSAVRRSGEMFNSPIFWAFSAICWKARAIM